MRIVSMVSGFTEVLFEIGAGDQVVGVSKYCSRYVKDLKAEVVGDYIFVDERKLRNLNPDLILLTSGIQERLSEELKKEGFPVFVLPLPRSINGIWENIISLGGLTGKLKEAKEMVYHHQEKLWHLGSLRKKQHQSVYVELWLGKHVRTIGGLTFIDDIIYFSGGKNIFSSRCESYIEPDLEVVEIIKPEFGIFFHEPDFPVDVEELLKTRNWNWFKKVIKMNIERGKNIIHDGPSVIETIAWLSNQLC